MGSIRLLKIRRISRNAADSTALAKQDARIDSYAEAMGHQIIGDAADSDVSGRTDPFTRPELGQWLTDPKLVASYDGIIASHLDRLGRSTRYVGRLLEWAEDQGKTVVCLEPMIDFSTATGKLMAFIIAWLAEQELQLITSRSAATKKWLRANNYLTGKPPFGFEIVDLDDHKTLAPDPALASKVREAVNQYLAGASLVAVGHYLGQSPATIGGLFRSTTLIGRQKDANGHTILRFEGILDRDTWRKLQAEMDRKARRTGVTRSKTPHYAMNTVVCWHCRMTMYRTRLRAGEFFRCRGTMQQPSKCRNMVRVEKVEQAVDTFMSGPYGQMNRVMETLVIPGDDDHSDELAEVEEELRDLDFDDPDFAAKQATLLAERRRIKDLPASPDVVMELPTDVRICDFWAMADSASRRDYLLKHRFLVRAKRDQVEVGWKEPVQVAIVGEVTVGSEGSTAATFSVEMRPSTSS